MTWAVRRLEGIMRLRRSALWSIVVILASAAPPAAVPTTVAASAPRRAADASPAALTPYEQRALDFRQTFGLDDGSELIIRAETDPNYSAIDYGVPLSTNEQSEMQRRVRLEQGIIPAADFARHQATWAGYYLDQHAAGAPVFLFTGDEPSIVPNLVKLLPPDTDFRVVHVSRTYDELETQKERILASAEEIRARGIKITHVGIDTIGNAVVVSIDGLTDEAQLMIESEFGSGIVFDDRPEAVLDSCPNSNCRPIKGGIEMDGSSGFACTAGFVVRRADHGAPLSILTAGHCIWVNGRSASLNKPWTHLNGTTHDKFGDSKYHTFYNHSPADVGIIEIDPDEQPSTANVLYIHNSSGGSTYSVIGYVPDFSQTVGSQACAYGMNSNDSACKAITNFDTADISEADGTTYTIDHVKEYSWNLIGGDSGGPIYQVYSGTQRVMLGTHVHSDPGGPGPGTGWYSPYNVGEAEYEVRSGGDSYYVCLNPTCTH
jgi:V8-like Glu-specific endopeptidase